MNRKFFSFVMMIAFCVTVFAQNEVPSTATSEDKKVVVVCATPNGTETTLTVDGVLYKLKISPTTTTEGGLQFKWEWLPTAPSEPKKVLVACSKPSETEAMLTVDGLRYKIKISPTTTAEGEAQFKWEWLPLD